MLKASGRHVDPNGLVSQSLPELAAAAIELLGGRTPAFVRSGPVQEATRPPCPHAGGRLSGVLLEPKPYFQTIICNL